MGLSEQDKNRIFGRIGLIIGGIPVFGVSLMLVDIICRKAGISFPIAMIFMVLIGGGVVWVIWKLFFASALTGRPENEALLRDGVPAVARVLQKADTGWTVNNQPKIELLLEVQLALPDCPAYQTKIKTTIPRLQPDRYDPGTVLEVRVDANDPKRVAIVGVASAEQEDHGSDAHAARPGKSQKNKSSRKEKRSTQGTQQEDQK